MSKAQPRRTNDRRQLLVWISVGIAAILVIVAIALGSRTPQAAMTPTASSAPLVVGQKAPDFSAATTQGPFTLADAKGKPVLLEVLATYCIHCQHETVVLNQLYDQYKDKVQFVGVTGAAIGMDGNTAASQADLIAFQQQFKVRYPLAFDPDLTVAHNYLLSGFPTIVVIGKDGKVAYADSGEQPPALIKKELDKALKG
jgi:peroxiredoxin